MIAIHISPTHRFKHKLTGNGKINQITRGHAELMVFMPIITVPRK